MTISQGPKILIVDDEAAHRLLAKRLIGKNWPNVTLLESSNLEQARAHVHDQTKIDLALVDLNLGLESGKELTSHLRRTWSIIELPIIIVSTSSLNEDIQESYLAGASCYIVKEQDATRYQSDLLQAINFFLRAFRKK